MPGSSEYDASAGVQDPAAAGPRGPGPHEQIPPNKPPWFDQPHPVAPWGQQQVLSKVCWSMRAWLNLVGFYGAAGGISHKGLRTVEPRLTRLHVTIVWAPQGPPLPVFTSVAFVSIWREWKEIRRGSFSRLQCLDSRWLRVGGS